MTTFLSPPNNGPLLWISLFPLVCKGPASKQLPIKLMFDCPDNFVCPVENLTIFLPPHFIKDKLFAGVCAESIDQTCILSSQQDVTSFNTGKVRYCWILLFTWINLARSLNWVRSAKNILYTRTDPGLCVVVGCDSREDAGMEGKDRFLTHPQGEGDNVVTRSMWAHSNHPRVRRLFVPSIEQAKEFPWCVLFSLLGFLMIYARTTLGTTSHGAMHGSWKTMEKTSSVNCCVTTILSFWTQ